MEAYDLQALGFLVMPTVIVHILFVGNEICIIAVDDTVACWPSATSMLKLSIAYDSPARMAAGACFSFVRGCKVCGHDDLDFTHDMVQSGSWSSR
jgi:hypothetical protein